MRGLFNWAVDADLVRANPTQGITTNKSKKIHVWTDDDIVVFERAGRVAHANK
jgi:site-specific recombinase XerC